VMLVAIDNHCLDSRFFALVIITVSRILCWVFSR
jgi:hypothetical protein